MIVSNESSWQATILTLFPEMFPGPLAHSLVGRALEDKIWELNTINIRDYATDKHRTVDDTCFGGGAGMVLRSDIIDAALRAVDVSVKTQFIYLTPRGKPLTQKIVKRLTHETSQLAILCGRYEGVDDRVIESWTESHGLEEISIGDYVLTGGEIAAFTLLDACVRLLPGVIGKQESLDNESFELELLEHPQYTRPQTWNNKIVPDVLLSGDHKKIAAWRQNEAEKITQVRRPDLWAVYQSKKT
jgi:tRNA (guanine37-N1)-methyltransferase